MARFKPSACFATLGVYITKVWLDMAFSLSGFADEISPNLDVQIQTLTRLGVTGLDLRSIEKINVLDLDQATLESVRQKCSEAGLHVQSIGSPVNKVPLLGSSQALETSKLEKAIDAAKATGTSVIRIFTPEVPATEFEHAWTSIEAWMA